MFYHNRLTDFNWDFVKIGKLRNVVQTQKRFIFSRILLILWRDAFFSASTSNWWCFSYNFHDIHDIFLLPKPLTQIHFDAMKLKIILYHISLDLIFECFFVYEFVKISQNPKFAILWRKSASYQSFLKGAAF